MTDSELSQILKRLPAEKAGAGFTGRLLERLATEEVRGRKQVLWRWAGSAAALVLLVAIAAGHFVSERQREERRRELDALRQAQRAARQTLTALERELAAEDVAFYLEDPRGVGWLVELPEPSPSGDRPQNTRVVPASWTQP